MGIQFTNEKDRNCFCFFFSIEHQAIDFDRVPVEQNYIKIKLDHSIVYCPWTSHAKCSNSSREDLLSKYCGPIQFN